MNARLKPDKDFHVVLMTIYSVENAGIRYVSAALQRKDLRPLLYFFGTGYTNQLTMPTQEEINLALDIMESKNRS